MKYREKNGPFVAYQIGLDEAAAGAVSPHRVADSAYSHVDARRSRYVVNGI